MKKEEIIQEESVRNFRLSAEEREIVLVMDEKDKVWHVSCSSPVYMRKFEKQGWKMVKEELYPDGTVCTRFYEAPKTAITIGKAERPKRVGKPMTEEHKAKLMAARAAKMSDTI